MYYKVEFDINNFKAWAGGKDTLDDLTWEQLQIVQEWITDLYSDSDTIPTETDINDILWFEREEIYELLGLDENGNDGIELDYIDKLMKLEGL